MDYNRGQIMMYKIEKNQIIGALIVSIIFLTAVDRIIPVVSYYVGLGSAPGGLVRGGIIILCLINAFYWIKRDIKKLDLSMGVLLSFFLFYTVVDYVFSDVPGKWFSYYTSFTSYYFYIYMFFLVLVAGVQLREPTATIITVIGCEVLGALAIAQWYLNDPIVDLDVLRGELEISFNEIYFYGHVRGFSMFSSGLASGLFCNLGFAICFSKFVFSRFGTWTNVFWGISTIFFIAVAYVTLTRVVYMQAIIIAFFVLVNKYFPSMRRHYYFYPVFSFFCGIFLAVVVPYFFQSDDGVASGESLQIRLGTWVKYLSDMYYSSANDILFGKQGVQAAVSFPAQSIIFDNTFIAIFYQLGLIGLMLWLIIFACLSRYAYEMVEDLKWSPYAIGIFSYFNTWLFIGVFNTRPGAGCLALSLLCVVWRNRKFVSR